MTRKLFFVLILGLFCLSGQAQEEAGWFNPWGSETDSLGSFFSNNITTPTFPYDAEKGESEALATPEAATPEIVELARGLRNDPRLIYEFVRNNIEYEHYFGSKKGALLTLLERKGNDFDQAALLTALLRSTGIGNTVYVFGYIRNPMFTPSEPNIGSWLGLEVAGLNFTNAAARLRTYSSQRGFPPMLQITNDQSVALPRVVVVYIATNAINYWLDPAFKAHSQQAGTNWAAALGLGRDEFLTAAGGTNVANGVHGLDVPSLTAQLKSRTSQFLTWINTNSPNASVDEVLGSRKVIAQAVSSLPTALPAYQGTITTSNGTFELPFTSWTNTPTNFQYSLRIQGGNIDRWLHFPLLAGERLSLTFSNEQATFWTNDAVFVSETGGSGVNFTSSFAINHPFAGLVLTNGQALLVDSNAVDQLWTNVFRRSATSNATYYTLPYAFSTSEATVRQRQKVLDEYIRIGKAANSREVITETMNLFGLAWYQQTRLIQRMLASAVGNFQQLHHHRFGVVAQEDAYYIDVAMDFGAGAPLAGNTNDNALWFIAGGLFNSAMEHGVIEQNQGADKQSVSTIKLLRLANQSNMPVYYTRLTNWNSVKSSLLDYPTPALALIGQRVTNGQTVMLPSSGKIGLNQWEGFGYAAAGASNAAMGIGRYNGGFLSYPSLVDYTPVIRSTYAQPNYNNSPPPTQWAPPGADPVSMADGAFQVDETALLVGQAEPRGLAFSRHYSSARRSQNSARLGFGWTHNYDIRVVERSAIEAALGETTPQQMAAMLVATKAALLVYSNATTAKEWLTAALIADWAVDQLLTNGVSVILGKDTLQFIRQPDGSFTSPAGVTMTLLRTNGVYELRQRHGNTFRFGTNHLIAEIEDQYGKKLTFAYHADGRLNTVQDAYTRTLTFGYTGDNELINSVSDSTGRSVSFVHTNRALMTATDEEGKLWAFDYDGSTRMLAMRDPYNRVVTTNTYDLLSRVKEQRGEGDPNKLWQLFYTGFCNTERDPEGGERRYYFDEHGRQVAFEDGVSNRVSSVYDGQDHVIARVSAKGETNTFLYDGAHNLLRATDPAGFYVTNTYDSLHHLVAVRDARGFTNTFGYNTKHQLTNSANALGQRVEYTHLTTGAAAGNVQTVKDAADKITTYSYDVTYGQLAGLQHPDSLGTLGFTTTARGDVEARTDGRGNTVNSRYNLRRQLLTNWLAGYFTNSLAYDLAGNLMISTDARGNTVTYSNSPTRKVLATAFPALTNGVPVTTNHYDRRDWRVAVVDPLLRTNRFVFDHAERLLAVGDPLLRTNWLGYDPNGQTLAATNALRHATSNRYNERGLMISASDALTNLIGYAHDPNGNLLALTNRLTNTFTATLDPLNRPATNATPLTKKTIRFWDVRGLLGTNREPSQQESTYTYDARGRLTQRVDGVGTNTYAYDADSNPLRVTENGRAVGRVFDALGRVTRYTNQWNEVLQFEHDANGNVTRLTYPDTNYFVRYFYDTHNRLTNVVDWANRVTAYAWDLAGQLKEVRRPNGTKRVLDYDLAGQLTTVTEFASNGVTKIFQSTLAYDAAGRITNEVRVPPPTAYAAVTVTATHDADNRLATFNGAAVAHDDDGNLTGGPLSNGVFTTFTYDARNRLTAAGSAGSLPAVSYIYDPEGNRVTVAVNGQTNRFTINPHAALSQALVRTKPDGTKTYYVYGLGLLYEVTGTAVRHHHYTHRGDTTALTDEQGKLTDRWEYAAYGRVTYRTGKTETPFQFGGMYGLQTDSNGLVYARARYYSPHLCRFLSADPARFAGGMNWYAYADGNPISQIDPLGLDPFGFNDVTWTDRGIGLTVDLLPVAGSIKSFTEVFTGRDVFTGTPVSPEQALAGMVLGMIPAGKGGRLARAANAVDHAADAGRAINAGSDSIRFTGQLGNDTGMGLFRMGEAAGEGNLPRTMETVLAHAESGGVGLKGINVKIIDEAPPQFFGWAHPSGKEIHLYPSAFNNTETLIKTLGHERTHAYQFQVFGPRVNADTTAAQLFEEAAKNIESTFFQYSKGGAK